MRALYRLYAITILVIFLSVNSFSQNQHFAKGQVVLQPAIGFFSTLDNTNDYGVGLTYPLQMPPVSLVADVGVTDVMNVGAYVATAKSDVYYEDLFQKIKLGSLSHFILGVRGLYHFSLLEQLDTYGGVMLGYNAVSATGVDDSEAKKSGLTYTLLAGARYPFSKHIGAFLELGYGVTAVNLGLSIKIKQH